MATCTMRMHEHVAISQIAAKTSMIKRVLKSPTCKRELQKEMKLFEAEQWHDSRLVIYLGLNRSLRSIRGEIVVNWSLRCCESLNGTS